MYFPPAKRRVTDVTQGTEEGNAMISSARSTTKKVLAAGGLALGLAGLGAFASAGTAVADGHNIIDEDGTWGDPDGAEQRGMSWAPAVDSYDTSSFPAATANDLHASPMPAPSWPASPSRPASPSWPGSGWGVADNP
jgi:hypothetical protein